MLRSRGTRATWMIIDQVLSSGTNLLLLLLVLRASSGAEFGAFSVALLIQGILLGGFRAVIGDTLLLRVRRDPGNSRTDGNLALTLVLSASGVLALAMATIGIFLPDPLRGFVLAMAVAVPFVQLQDMERYLAFSTDRPRAAVALDLGWLVAQVAMSAVVLALTGDPVYLVLAWAAGAASSAVAGLIGMPWGFARRGIRQLIREECGRSCSFLGDFALITGGAEAAFLGLSAVLTLAGFGLLRFAQSVTSPLTNLLSVVRILTLGYFGRLCSPTRTARRATWVGAAGYAAVTMSFVAVILTIPQDIGTAVLGSLWSEARPLLVFAGIGEAVRVAQFPAIDYLKAFVPGSALVTARGITGLITTASLFAGGVFGGPRGALVALIFANLLALAWWLHAVQRAHNSSSSEPVNPGLGRTRSRNKA